MNGLFKTLVLAGALSVLAGADGAKAVQELSCSQTKCSYNEEFGPSQTKTFHGHCNSSTPMTSGNSKMICYKAEFLACSTGVIENQGKSDTFWKCTCINGSDKNRAYTTISLSCP